MFSTFLKDLSILKKFLFINLIFFTVIGLFTFIYLDNVQPNLIKKKSSNHIEIINNTVDNLNRLNVNNNIMTTRASATDFFVPRVSGQGANTFFFTAIKEWNSLSTDLKNINCENSFKEKLKLELVEAAKRKDNDEFERFV